MTESRDWMVKAACRGTDPELFFPERGEGWKLPQAQAICARCPVAVECWDDAERNDVRFGIRAGRKRESVVPVATETHCRYGHRWRAETLTWRSPPPSRPGRRPTRVCLICRPMEAPVGPVPRCEVCAMELPPGAELGACARCTEVVEPVGPVGPVVPPSVPDTGS